MTDDYVGCRLLWQQFKIGIIVGCTISSFPHGDGGDHNGISLGCCLQDGTWLPPIRAFMDDILTITTTALCTRLLLLKLNENLGSGMPGFTVEPSGWA